jgi:phytoene dehydrogenase-like protein
VTEPLWPGFQVSTASYLVSLLLPEIVRDLDLERFGYRVLIRSPSSFTPADDGRYLFLGSDHDFNRREIAKFSERDAANFGQYEAFLEQVARCLEPALTATPPDLLPLPRSWRKISWFKRIRDFRQAVRLYRALTQLGDRLPESLELLVGPARTVLDRWFDSDIVKATLATDAIIGTFQPISAPGTAYVLLHHVMGSAGGARGVWGYVEGGMGAISRAMAESAKEKGVEILTDAAVSHIDVSSRTVAGVVLEDGRRFGARRVASSADAHVTFEKLLHSDALPVSFLAAIRRIDYSNASMKINLAVSELPDFTCLPGHAEVGPQHRGTIHIGCTLDSLERAYDDAKYGEPSRRPIIEMTIPTSVDRTLAPAGRHILSLFVQYAPYKLASGTWDAIKDDFADRCIAEIARYAPNVPGSILHRQVLSPVDLERVFGLTEGNIFQGAMPLHQLFSLRPVAGYSDYRTPVDGLYLCGSAAHPGGGVFGAPGRNAAREILRDGR